MNADDRFDEMHRELPVVQPVKASVWRGTVPSSKAIRFALNAAAASATAVGGIQTGLARPRPIARRAPSSPFPSSRQARLSCASTGRTLARRFCTARPPGTYER